MDLMIGVLRMGLIGVMILWGGLAYAGEPGAKGVGGNLDVQYAQVLLTLAEARLEQAQQQNASVPGVVRRAQLDSLLRDVAVAKRFGEQAQQHGKADWYTLLLAYAEAASSSAEADWNEVRRIEARYPGTFSQLDLKIRRLRADLTRLNAARGKQLASASMEDRQGWALQVLWVEIERLQNRTLQLEGFR